MLLAGSYETTILFGVCLFLSLNTPIFMLKLSIMSAQVAFVVSDAVADIVIAT